MRERTYLSIADDSARMPRIDSLRDAFWKRHSNPKSGWSRVLVLPALLAAVYHRNGRLAAVAVVFTVINPVLFSPVEDDDAWMTRVVLAERWWTERGNGTLTLSYPGFLNLLNVPITAYAFLAASREEPARTALAGAVSMGLKFWYVGALVRRYEAATERGVDDRTTDE